jgi:beta-glucosidase
MPLDLDDLDAYVDGLTLAEKASLTSGADFWTTTPLPRTGLPSIVLTDGPHGVRLQRAQADHLGISESVPATCFPPAVTLGSTFDAELVERVGVALGEEARAEGVGVLLGPGINIKRSPLCGRNFEYLSEDPLVSGVLGAALVRGLQSRGVGAVAEAFRRQQPGDRPAPGLGRHRPAAAARDLPARLRAGGGRCADRGPSCRPTTASTGPTPAQDLWLLTCVLRDEWGFDGLVVSDWGAVEDRVAASPGRPRPRDARRRWPHRRPGAGRRRVGGA